MDIETRLLGRRSYRWKCDLHQAGGLVGGNDPMKASCSRSDPDVSDVELPYHPLPPALTSCEPCVSERRNTSWVGLIKFLLIAILAFVEPATAAFVNFDNCMSPDVVHSLQLHFMPLFVNAIFNSSAVTHNLKITVYGNVSGSSPSAPLPGPTDPHWQNPNETEGKIPKLGHDNKKYTTLQTTFNVLDYTPYNNVSSFCDSTVQSCPLAPDFTDTG